MELIEEVTEVVKIAVLNLWAMDRKCTKDEIHSVTCKQRQTARRYR